MSTTPEILHLTEWTPVEAECSLETIRVLQNVFRADVSPVRTVGREPTWRVRPSGVVGVAQSDSVLVVVRPRIPVANLLALAGASSTPWTDDDAPAGERDDVHLALARLFVVTVERTLSEGVLRGYREQHDQLLTVRGRIDLAEQIRRRPGRNLPLAVTYQEHDEDVVENRLIKAAAVALQRLSFDDRPLQRGLHRIVMALHAVTDLTPGAGPLPVHWTRLNERYKPGVQLAQLVLENVGLDLVGGRTPARSLTLDMPRVFEDFLSRELGRRLEARGGVARAQDTRWWLDESRQISLRPDLVWDVGGRPAAVVDAKYQTVGPRDVHGDNAYQMLAYCTTLGLDAGHLVYANVDGDRPEPVRVVRAGPMVYQHGLDLSTPFPVIIGQLDALAGAIAQRSSHVARELHQVSSRSTSDVPVLAP